MLSLAYLKVSVISRMDGLGGKINVPRAMYSFRMSFWMVPESKSSATLLFFARTTYIARSTEAVALMVMETETLSRGIWSKRISISSKVSIATPVFPTSPSDRT